MRRASTILAMTGLLLGMAPAGARPFFGPPNPLLGDWGAEQLVGPCKAAFLQFKPDRVIFSLKGSPDDVRRVTYHVVSATKVEVQPEGAMKKVFDLSRGRIPFKECTFHKIP